MFVLLLGKHQHSRNC